MNLRQSVATTFLALFGATSLLHAQEWHDPSPHSIQFVTVDKDVKLEVLDWGGSGRPVVLLAGLGNTAHVFDDFAPKLTSEYHVYGITRRGFGASSAPAPADNNYSSDRLGDDVLAVFDALKLDRPVLVGHSIGGEELSSLGTRRPQRVAGLIYLDGLNPYSYWYPGADLNLDLPYLQKKLDQLKIEQPHADQEVLIHDLIQNELPGLGKALKERLQYLEAAPSKTASGPAPTPDDLASYGAFQSWLKRVGGLDFPESDLRATRETATDGRVGKPRSSPGAAVIWGEQRYTNLTVPVLAIYANPKEPGPFPYNTPAERVASEAQQETSIETFMKAFEIGVPSARVVRLPHASHYVFLSNEMDVLREMRLFLGDLQH